MKEQYPSDFKHLSVFSLRTRIVLGGFCISIALLVIASAWTLPFLFESSSILYKFGFDKTLLRSGKLLGLTAASLLYFQIVLVSRFMILDRIFSLNRMVTLHRASGITIVSLALVHAVLVVASENFIIFTFEMKYWPEFLGIGLLVFTLGLVAAAIWRMAFGIAYDTWLRLHRISVLVALAVLTIHILFVSSTFESGLPRIVVLAAVGCNLLLAARIWWRRLFPGRRRFVVTNISPVGRNAYGVEVKSDDGEVFDYIPGQFAFVTPVSQGLPREEHPFTISSTPTQPGTLQFNIRSLGDWTGRIGQLKVGEPIFIDGPYGLFSYLVSPTNEPVIMIVGGIGITPMLSMLRYMADVGDQRQVLLIWSNKTQEEIVHPEEFKELQQQLQGLRIIHVLTRAKTGGDETGRLDQAKLERLLNGWSRTSKVFICGPPAMMETVERAVKSLGFSARIIYKEAFRL